MSDISRRDFIKAGVVGAALLTYVTPRIETILIANAWADEEGGRPFEGRDRGVRHPSKKMMMKHSPRGGGGGLEMEHGED